MIRHFALPIAIALGCTAAAAAETPPADKLIALVLSANCDVAGLSSRLDATGQALARDRRTTRVSIDRPADPARNLDLMGRPSPFVAAIEVSARASALLALARRLRSGIGGECPTQVYLVHERRLMAIARTWPLGTPSPATKTLVVFFRKPGMSPEAFDREWAGPHAALALGWRKARGGDGHYVQNLIVGRIGAGGLTPDGIGESEGSSVSPPSPAEREARLKTATHAQTFQDVARSTMFIASETILKD